MITPADISTAVIGRFAPSPTGEMHLGNVAAALLSWLSAKQQGGMWRLRIEDLDPQRSRQEYADRLMSDLEWLGLTWDGEVLYQSQRTDIYRQYLQQLQDYTYLCTCTRNEILAAQAPHESDGRIVYPGTCRNKQVTGRPAAVRLMVPNEDIIYDDRVYGQQTVNLATHCGDFILRRSDGVFAYQLAVVVDDALSGVTEVVRGRDLLLSAAQQIYLYRLLGFAPPVYCHHPLLVNNQGQRLCKRDRSLALGAMRTNRTAEQIIGQLAHALGLVAAPEPMTPEQLLPLFTWDNIPKQDIKIYEYED
ncbi:MAG: tRNA glutamyl-Q(34) synthetase GluQRS [Paludibacteraceae bacterium]|nr:tRNA glutamyl-Q(34) synthetase GluQRS [Paludibacteraceae bacterium]